MAVATFDFQDAVGRNRPQTTRRVEIPFRVDFAAMGDGTGLAAGEDAAVLKTPKGFVKTGFEPFLIVAEGEAATVDIGTEADADGLLDGGNMNGTAGAAIVLAGNETILNGTYLSETEIRVKCPAAAATLNVGVLFGVLRGYVIDKPAA